MIRTAVRQRGVTLVELVMTIVVLGIGIAGVVSAFALSASRSSDLLIESRAVELAQLYFDEISARYYDEATGAGGTPTYTGPCNIGPDAGESRSTFDDVDDYDGLDDEPPRSSDGAITGYSEFRVRVSVVCDGTALGLPADDAKRIDLRVTGPAGLDFGFSSYRANF